MNKTIKYIINKYHNFHDYFQKINIPLLASSLTFYLIIIFIPVTALIISILNKLNLIESDNNIFNNLTLIKGCIVFLAIIFIINKLINTLSLISDVVYVDYPFRKRLLLKIRSFLLVILLILIAVIQISLSLFIIYTFNRFVNYHYLINIISFFIKQINIILMMGIIYKLIIPIKIKLKQTLIVSFGISIIENIITLIFKSGLIKFANYKNIYGNLDGLFIILSWLYLLSVVFIYGLVINYYLQIKGKKLIDGYNNNEQAR